MSSQDFWSIQLRDILNFLILIATIVAIFWGPIKAVQITRAHDPYREERRRKLDIFNALMRTRRIILSHDRVMALNLVQAEFYDDTRVIESFKRYIEHFSQPVPKDQAQWFFEAREDLSLEMIKEIARCLGFNFDKHELKRYAYSPQGWQTEQEEFQVFRRLMIEVLSGVRGLPVAEFKGNSTKFPPPPSVV
jgi:hypothetical protein